MDLEDVVTATDQLLGYPRFGTQGNAWKRRVNARFSRRRGKNLAIFETGEDGVRIHQVRYRARDGRFVLKGMTPIDEESVNRSEINRLNAAFLAD